MKVSVIVPIYCVENYLSQCVESVLNQTYMNIELILVDDGSPDRCPLICDEWGKKDRRIKVIHKINGGLSDARNEGIRVATGEYVLFLDGDDFWKDDDALARLTNRLKITKADVLNFSYIKYYEDTGEYDSYFEALPNMPELLSNINAELDYITSHGLYIASACNKMIRRNLLTEDMFFKKGVYSEDVEWCLRLLSKVNRIDFICENFYCYRQRKDSISHSIDGKKCFDLKENILACFDICNSILDEEKKKYFYRYVAYQYGTFFKVQALTENAQSDIIEELKNYKWILKYHCNNKKLILLHWLCTVLGVKKACWMMRQIYRRS